MHYAFESEAKAKGMLANVAGSLKKGGRFLGVAPNSDAIRSGVEAFHQRRAKAAANDLNAKAEVTDHERNNRVPHTITSRVPETAGQEKQPASWKRKAPEEMDGEPPAKKVENSEEPNPKTEATAAINILTEPPSEPSLIEGRSDAKGEKLNERGPDSVLQGEKGHAESGNGPFVSKDDELEVAEWGNSIYRVRFPGDTPKDGIFRPPYGWKYSYFLEEAVEEIPEYVVPWEAFRAYEIAFSKLDITPC